MLGQSRAGGPNMRYVLVCGLLSLGSISTVRALFVAPALGLQASHSHVDMGALAEADRRSRSVRITNLSDKVAHIMDVQSQCSCVEGRARRDSVPPGGHVWIDVDLRPKGIKTSGRIERQLLVTYALADALDQPQHVTLTVTASLQEEFRLEWDAKWRAGPDGRSHQCTVSVHRGLLSPEEHGELQLKADPKWNVRRRVSGDEGGPVEFELSAPEGTIRDALPLEVHYSRDRSHRSRTILVPELPVAVPRLNPQVYSVDLASIGEGHALDSASRQTFRLSDASVGRIIAVRWVGPESVSVASQLDPARPTNVDVWLTDDRGGSDPSVGQLAVDYESVAGMRRTVFASAIVLR